MPKRLVIEVVAHTKRRKIAEQLSDTIQANRVWYDNGRLGEWENHKRAWESAAESGATHAVILQDDAVPIENFQELVAQAVEAKPNELISLYVGTYRPRRQEVLRAVEQAEKSSASWLVSDTLHWGVGVVVPVPLIPEILETVKKSRLPYDQRIGSWAEMTGRAIYYTWPSLVDHADEPTVIKGRSPSQGIRVAHKVDVPLWNDREVRILRSDSNFLSSTRDKG